MQMNANAIANCSAGPVSEVKACMNSAAASVQTNATSPIRASATVTSRSTKSCPPSGRFIALVICGISTAFRMPAESSTRMKFGSVFALVNASPTTAVPSTATCSDAFTMPSTRLTRVPDAISSELRPRFLRSALSISSTSEVPLGCGSASGSMGASDAATAAATCWASEASDSAGASVSPVWSGPPAASSASSSERSITRVLMNSSGSSARLGTTCSAAARFGASGSRGLTAPSGAARSGRSSGASVGWVNDRFPRRRQPLRPRRARRRCARPARRRPHRRRPPPPRCGSRRSRSSRC